MAKRKFGSLALLVLLLAVTLILTSCELLDELAPYWISSKKKIFQHRKVYTSFFIDVK